MSHVMVVNKDNLPIEKGYIEKIHFTPEHISLVHTSRINKENRCLMGLVHYTDVDNSNHGQLLHLVFTITEGEKTIHSLFTACYTGRILYVQPENQDETVMDIAESILYAAHIHAEYEGGHILHDSWFDGYLIHAVEVGLVIRTRQDRSTFHMDSKFVMAGWYTLEELKEKFTQVEFDPFSKMYMEHLTKEVEA